MNYLIWSQEYLDTADMMQKVIDKLNARRKGASKTEKKELEDKIYKYRGYRGECLRIAALLRSRHRDAA
jgi:hypothetical protein